jgi:hypothetical protein
MRLGRLLWGLIVIFIGVIFLLINFGYLNSSVWANVWQLWPLILVVIGLSILGRSMSEAGKMIMNVLAILILLVGFILVVSPNNRLSSRVVNKNRETTVIDTIDESLTGSNKPLNVEIKTGASKLNINGSTDKFATGTLESDFTQLEINRSTSTKEDKLEILTNVRRKIIGFGKNDLTLALNGELPLSLELDTGALDGKLDLSELNLKTIDIKSGASSYDITFGSKADLTQADFNIGASSISLHIPKELGIKINSKSGLSSNNFSSQDIIKRDVISSSETIYTTDNYDQAAKKIELTFKAGASSISLDRF